MIHASMHPRTVSEIICKLLVIETLYIIGLKEGLNESFNGTESDDDLHIEQSVDEEQMEHEDGLDAQNLVYY